MCTVCSLKGQYITIITLPLYCVSRLVKAVLSMCNLHEVISLCINVLSLHRTQDVDPKTMYIGNYFGSVLLGTPRVSH